MSGFDVAAFDGHRLGNLRKLIGSIGDPQKIGGIIDGLMGLFKLIAPLIPIASNEASALSHESLATALEVHRADIEAQGINFGSLVSLLMAVVPLVQRIRAGDFTAFGELLAAVVAFIATLNPAAS
jgi:hypothetical protein